MILSGLNLSLLGMIVVFLFLGAMILIIDFSKKILKPFTEKEMLENELTLQRMRGKTDVAADKTTDVTADKTRLMAVISAAITAHRARFQT